MLELHEKNVIAIVSGITWSDITADTQERILRLLEKWKKLLSWKTEYQKEIAFTILSLSDEKVWKNFFDLRTIALSNPDSWIHIVHELWITQEDSYLTELEIIHSNQTLGYISTFSKDIMEKLKRDLWDNVLSITQEQWEKWFGYIIKKRFRIDFESPQKTIPSERKLHLLTALWNRDF